MDRVVLVLQVRNKMLTVVYSTRKENPEYQKHIKQTIGLKDFEILEYTNDRQYSLTELYNKGLEESSGDIVVFIHDDLLFEQDSKWGKKILKHFENSDYGILGKAGTTSLTQSGRWWDESHLMVGSVYHTQYYEDSKKRVTWESRYSGLFHDKILPVVLVDGLFIAVNKKRIKKNFDENIKGFHLYDVDFSIANHFAGVKIGVVFDFKLTHKSIGMTNEEWEQNRKQLVQKWAFYTDEQGNKHLGLPVSIEPDNIEYEDVKVRIKNEPKVAVIIPTKSKVDILFKCLDSFREKSKYQNYKIYIADTGSNDNEIVSIENYIDNNDFKKYELIRYDYYNFAKINNDVVNNHIDKDTELLLFCNNDIELVNDALSIMVEHYTKHKHEVGTIGARLHYPNKTIQHAGIRLLINRENRLFIDNKGSKSFYNYEPREVINIFGNTGAFLLVPKHQFLNVSGFNEKYNECFEDVELNIKQILNGKLNIFCGTAVCIHHESLSRDKNYKEEEKNDFNKTLAPFINNLLNTNEKIRKFLHMI